MAIYERCYRIPRFNVAVQTNCDELHADFSRLFGLSPQVVGTPDIVIEATNAPAAEFVERIPGWIRQQQCREPVDSQPTMIYGSNQQIAAVAGYRGSRCLAWIDGADNLIKLIWIPQEFESTPLLVQTVIVPILREIYLNNDLLLVHCACLQTLDGGGMLLAGASGAGKTTLAISMMRAGARLVSDDLVLLGVADESTIAFGIRKQFTLRAPTIGFFNELKNIPPHEFQKYRGRNKSVSPARLFGKNCFADEVSIRSVYFLGDRQMDPVTHRVSASESIQKLILASCFCRNQQITGEMVSLVVRILDCVSVFDLLPGSDPIHVGQWLMNHGASDLANEGLSKSG